MVWICIWGGLAQQIFNTLSPRQSLPSEMDEDITSLTRTSRTLLSPETFWSVLLFTFLASQTDRSNAIATYVFAAFVVSISRLIATSHFCYQILASSALAVVLNLAWTFTLFVFFSGKAPTLHFNIMGTILFSAALVVIFMLQIENNEFEPFARRRSEYVNVLQTIVSAEATNRAAQRRGTPTSHFDYRRFERNKSMHGKKDSFFFLAQNLRKRNSNTSRGVEKTTRRRVRFDRDDTKPRVVFEKP